MFGNVDWLAFNTGSASSSALGYQTLIWEHLIPDAFWGMTPVNVHTVPACTVIRTSVTPAEASLLLLNKI